MLSHNVQWLDKMYTEYKGIQCKKYLSIKPMSRNDSEKEEIENIPTMNIYLPPKQEEEQKKERLKRIQRRNKSTTI